MHKTLTSAAAAGLISLAAITPAHAAEGTSTISLTDNEGHHHCSATLVAPDWALTWSDTARCGKNDTVTDNAGDHASVTERRYFHFTDGITPTDPSKTQAMLVHLSKPLAHATPARLSDAAPKPGEHLTAATVHGDVPVTIEGHNAWLSWFDSDLEKSDAGAPLLRDGKAVAFVGTPGDAEDISNVSEWVKDVTR